MEGAIICYYKFIPWTSQHINKLSRTEKVYLKRSTGPFCRMLGNKKSPPFLYSYRLANFPTFIFMSWGKSPNYDAYGLFRALHSHNPSIIFTVLHHLLRLPADPDYPSEVQYLPSYLP